MKLFYHATKNVSIQIQSNVNINFQYNYIIIVKSYYKIGIKYETLLKSTSTQSFSNEIWSGLKIGKLFPSDFDSKQKLEYTKLTEYSKYLMINNLNNIKTILNYINKSIDGYNIYRSNSNNRFMINININTNQIELKRNIY